MGRKLIILLQKLLFLFVFKVLSCFMLYALVKSYAEILKRSSAGLPLCTARNPHLLSFFKYFFIKIIPINLLAFYFKHSHNRSCQVCKQ